MTANAREFEFTDADFEAVRKHIYDYAGIALNESKKDMVYSRLARRLRTAGLSSFHDYLKLLQGNDKTECQAFINALTTNLTSFFREQHHFSILAEHVRTRRGHYPITLWCSACSTGEEPYSMAMTMVDLFDSLTPPVQIIASDLDTRVLKKAEEGLYTTEQLAKLPAETLRRFFVQEPGTNQLLARVRPELRNMVKFRQINLLDGRWPLRPPFDAIFCRNVMIYFDKPTQLRILEKFVPLLRADGLLFAGHSESFYHAPHLFTLVGNTVYRIADRHMSNHG